MKRISKIWMLTSEELQNTIDNCSSYSEVLRKLNCNTATGGNYRTLKKRIDQENINIETLNNNRKVFYSNQCIKINQSKKCEIKKILKKDSNYSRTYLKNRLIQENILEYKCLECGISDLWNNKPISLQLDHINGISNDNRLENLRFLCPNCHSQTDNYSGKANKKLPNKHCIDCSTTINKYGNSKRCKSCSAKQNNKRIKKFEVEREDLINLIKQYPMTKVGKILGVSDNAIRKRCKTLNIDYKKI